MTLPPIPHALASVALGPTIEHGMLAVTPLVGDDDPACEYLTLDEALAADLIDITEVSDTGSVPELRVRNSAPKPVLIIDGEELVGAKQNRVINLTVLVPAHSNTTIPVSCVEAGRWRYDSVRFTSSPRTQFASGRAEKMAQVSDAMSTSGVPRSDQSAVWDAIAEKASRMRSRSDTGAMSAIFEQHADSVDDYVARFDVVDRQRGAVFSVHGRPCGVELFDRSDILRRLMPKLIRSYAIEAVDEAPGAPTPALQPSSLLKSVAAADVRGFPTIGQGTDVRLEGKSLVGAALVTNDRVLHLAAFATDATRRRPRPTVG